MERVAVGAMVRVPLGGRRVRGFIVEVREHRDGKLKPLSSISGQAEVFDAALLTSLEWGAGHYVAPLSVLLQRAAPPNLPRSKGQSVDEAVPEPGDHPAARGT